MQVPIERYTSHTECLASKYVSVGPVLECRRPTTGRCGLKSCGLPIHESRAGVAATGRWAGGRMVGARQARRWPGFGMTLRASTAAWLGEEGRATGREFKKCCARSQGMGTRMTHPWRHCLTLPADLAAVTNLARCCPWQDSRQVLAAPGRWVGHLFVRQVEDTERE